MPVFVDTSAILAFLCESDLHHRRARAVFERLQTETTPLVTTSYVLVETYALLERRLGREATRRFHEDFAPLLEVSWVDSEAHERGVDLLLGGSGSISLVDAVSFVYCRRLGIDRAWAFDRHFEDAGLPCPLP